MGGGGGSSDSTVRYAPYLETAHSYILNHAGTDVPALSFIDAFNNAVGSSPYDDYVQIDVNKGFLGEGYGVGNFPSLWDMFGKFMAGLDVHDLWGQIYEDVIQGPEVENAIVAQSALLQDEIDLNVMPKFLAGMRDINSVQATSFVIGKAIIQDAHVKSINSFAAKLKTQAIVLANEQWNKHLDWNQAVIGTFSGMFKLYYASKMDVDRVNLEYQAKDNMWDINLFENARGILGAMSGAAASAAGNEPSQTQKAIGGAMSGAASGAMIGSAVPGIGTAVGAVVGGLVGLASSFL